MTVRFNTDKNINRREAFTAPNVPQSEHPHGLSDMDFDALFTKDKPIIMELI